MAGLLRAPGTAASTCFAYRSWNLSGCPPWGIGGEGCVASWGFPRPVSPQSSVVFTGLVLECLFLLHVRVAATRGQQALRLLKASSSCMSGWRPRGGSRRRGIERAAAWALVLGCLTNGWSLVWLGLPSSEMIWVGRRSESLFASFSSSIEKGLLLLNGTWGTGFIFLWGLKGPRLSAGVRKHWWVGGRVGARSSRHHEVGTL